MAIKGEALIVFVLIFKFQYLVKSLYKDYKMSRLVTSG